MQEYPSTGQGLPSDPLTSDHGGTGLNTSGSDPTKVLGSDGSGGFHMVTGQVIPKAFYTGATGYAQRTIAAPLI